MVHVAGESENIGIRNAVHANLVRCLADQNPTKAADRAIFQRSTQIHLRKRLRIEWWTIVLKSQNKL